MTIIISENMKLVVLRGEDAERASGLDGDRRLKGGAQRRGRSRRRSVLA